MYKSFTKPEPDFQVYLFVSLNVVVFCPPASVSEKKLPPVKDTLKDILKKIPKSRRFKNQDWDKTPRSRIRATLGVPLIYRLYQIKKNQFLKAKYDEICC